MHNLGRQEFVNVTHGTGSNGGTQPASSTTTTSRCDNVGYSAAAVVLGSSGHPEVDASVREALEKFFPSNLKGVEGGDMYAAGMSMMHIERNNLKTIQLMSDNEFFLLTLKY